MKRFLIGLTLLVTSGIALAEQHAANPAETALSGEFEGGWLSKVEGSWKIERSGDQWVLKTGKDFKASKGPDVKVFLSRTPADDVTGKNASQGSVFVQLLDNFKGEMVIPLPSGVDPREYQTLVLHCEEYTKLWGATEIVPQ